MHLYIHTAGDPASPHYDSLYLSRSHATDRLWYVSSGLNLIHVKQRPEGEEGRGTRREKERDREREGAERKANRMKRVKRKRERELEIESEREGQRREKRESAAFLMCLISGGSKGRNPIFGPLFLCVFSHI